MGGKAEEACAECTRKCLLIHGKNKRSSSIISFFKVMIGDQFSKILFLPPKFAHTVSNLVGQKGHLEDSSGRQWGVTLSNLKGSFAFQEGWHAFALDHGLQIGDFIVFHYIMGSHFVVQIYSKSGCEKKLDFSEANGSRKKRTRTTKNSVAKDGSCHTIDKGSMNKQGSSTSAVSGSDIELIKSQCDVYDVGKTPMAMENTSKCDNSNRAPLPVCKAAYVEEPYYMIDRDLTYKQGDDRTSIFDLSNFEMCNNISGADERSLYPADISLRARTEAGLVDKDPVAEEVATRVVSSDTSHFFEMIEINTDCEVMDKIPSTSDKASCNGKTSGHLLTTCAIKPGENGKTNPLASNKVIKKCQIAESERMMLVKQELVEMISEECTHEEMIQDIHGKEPEVMKREQGHSSNPAVKDNDNAYKMVKTEAVDSIDLSSPPATNISCLVVPNNQSFLELPMCLPSNKGRMRMDRKVVLLRDPVMRLWPVLYHEKVDVKVLTSGWEAFSRANNLQPGDECVFGVESEPEGIYAVRIIRR